MDAYLCLVKWPDGQEGLLFPRPGNVQITRTKELGLVDFDTVREHLKDYAVEHPRLVEGTSVRLFRFEQFEAIAEFVYESRGKG